MSDNNMDDELMGNPVFKIKDCNELSMSVDILLFHSNGDPWMSVKQDYYKYTDQSKCCKLIYSGIYVPAPICSIEQLRMLIDKGLMEPADLLKAFGEACRPSGRTETANIPNMVKTCFVYKWIEKRIKTALQDIPRKYHTDELRDVLDTLMKVYKASLLASVSFVTDNRESICNMCNDIEQYKLMNKQEKRKIVNKRYYESHKVILPPRQKLTEEEKKEKRKLANKKYYDKRRLRQDNSDKTP